MAIKIAYQGPYKVPRFLNQYGGYDLKAIEKKVASQVPDNTALGSGVYIYIHRRGKGKLEARYVGVNTNDHLLAEAFNKTNILSNQFLQEHGTPLLLFLKCKRPQGMPDDSFKDALLTLEDYLIADLSLKGHKLYNKKNRPRKSRFDFAIKGKSRATMTFKKIVNRRGLPHI